MSYEPRHLRRPAPRLPRPGDVRAGLWLMTVGALLLAPALGAAFLVPLARVPVAL